MNTHYVAACNAGVGNKRRRYILSVKISTCLLFSLAVLQNKLSIFKMNLTSSCFVNLHKVRSLHVEGFVIGVPCHRYSSYIS